MTTQPPSLMDRVQILNRPLLSPGKCCVCGAVDRPVIDFGLDIDRFGRVYFCEFDIHNIAKIIGMVPHDELRDNEREAESIVADYCRTKNLRLVSDEFVDSYLRSVSVFTSDSLANAIVPASDEDYDYDAAGDSTESSSDSIQDAVESSGTNDDDDESASGEGSTSVPADSGDAKPAFNF